MLRALVGLICGLTVGYLCPLSLPATLLPVALDALLGGLLAAVRGRFDNVLFVTGFLSNAMLAVFLVFIGDKFAMDLRVVVWLVFGLRLFKNLARLRRHLLKFL